jgi:hypothetical protein
MSSSFDFPRRLACMAAGLLATACAGAHLAPASNSVCPVRPEAPVTRIDIFDGDPAELAALAPDDEQSAPDTYTVSGIYAQGRHVTVRCHYGKASQDIALTAPVSRCQFSGADTQPALVCK